MHNKHRDVLDPLPIARRTRAMPLGDVVFPAHVPVPRSFDMSLVSSFCDTIRARFCP